MRKMNSGRSILLAHLFSQNFKGELIKMHFSNQLNRFQIEITLSLVILLLFFYSLLQPKLCMEAIVKEIEIL